MHLLDASLFPVYITLLRSGRVKVPAAIYPIKLREGKTAVIYMEIITLISARYLTIYYVIKDLSE